MGRWVGLIALAGLALACSDEPTTSNLSGGSSPSGTSSASDTDTDSDGSTTAAEGEGSGSTTMTFDAPDPIDNAAFRVTEFELVDPHLFASLVTGDPDPPCVDATSFLNDSAIGPAITVGDLHLVVWFPLLDRGAAQNDVSLMAGTCEPMNGPTMCGPPLDPADQIDTTADIRNSGNCHDADPSSLGEGYILPSDAPAPCFGSVRMDATLNLSVSGTEIPIVLHDAQIAATFDGDGLSAGTLAGFMTEANASVTQIDDGDFVEGGASLWDLVAGAAACETSRDDTDMHSTYGRGVWIYFNFEAGPISWSG